MPKKLRKLYYVARLYTSDKKVFIGYGFNEDSAKRNALEYARKQDSNFNSLDKFEKVTADPAIGRLPQCLRGGDSSQ